MFVLDLETVKCEQGRLGSGAVRAHTDGRGHCCIGRDSTFPNPSQNMERQAEEPRTPLVWNAMGDVLFPPDPTSLRIAQEGVHYRPRLSSMDGRVQDARPFFPGRGRVGIIVSRWASWTLMYGVLYCVLDELSFSPRRKSVNDHIRACVVLNVMGTLAFVWVQSHVLKRRMVALASPSPVSRCCRISHWSVQWAVRAGSALAWAVMDTWQTNSLKNGHIDTSDTVSVTCYVLAGMMCTAVALWNSCWWGTRRRFYCGLFRAKRVFVWANPLLFPLAFVVVSTLCLLSIAWCGNQSFSPNVCGLSSERGSECDTEFHPHHYQVSWIFWMSCLCSDRVSSLARLVLEGVFLHGLVAYGPDSLI